MLLDHRRGKKILREAYADVLPAQILTRPKRGFGVPIAVWMRENLRDMLGDLLVATDAPVGGLLDPGAVRPLVGRFLSGDDRRRTGCGTCWRSRVGTTPAAPRGACDMRDESELLATLERSTRTGVHVLGLRRRHLRAGVLRQRADGAGLGPEGRGRYVLPLAVLTIMFTLGNLGLEHAQVYLAGQGRRYRACGRTPRWSASSARSSVEG